MSCVNKTSFISSFLILMHFISFPCLATLAKKSTWWWIEVVKHPCLVSYLRGEVLSLVSSLWCQPKFLYIHPSFIKLRNQKFLIRNGIFFKCFFSVCWAIHVVFLFHLLIWLIMFIYIQMLNQFCILRISLTWS